MARKPKAILRFPNDNQARIPRWVAFTLVESGLAEIEKTTPLEVRLIAVLRIRQALIPANCREYLEEYLHSCEWTFNHKHRGWESETTREIRRLKADYYKRLPHGS